MIIKEKIFRYKDRNPEDTVLLIYEFLCELNQIVEVDVRYSNCYYSAKLRLGNTEIFSEGKGRTKSYCIASAFAEMLERLLNLAYYRIRTDDLYYYSVDTLVHSEVNNDLFSQYYTNFIKCYSLETKIKSGLLALISSYGIKPNVVTKYYHMYEPYTHMFPTKLIDLLYGTNGMSAGNSEYEGMSQAFCEIIERHYIRLLLKKEISLFEITNELEQGNEYKEIIETIRGVGLESNIYLIQNDIGVSICVLAISQPLVDNVICKIGVHPKRKFAIDRTFSELFQNQGVQSIYTQLMDSKPLGDYESLDNFLNISRNNSGFFPSAIFNRRADQSWDDIEFYSYEQACKHIINYFKKQKYDIYYTKFKYKNMFVYHIIIPRYGELINPDELTDDVLLINTTITKVRTMLKDFYYLSLDQYKYLLDVFSGYTDVLPGILEIYRKDCRFNDTIDWNNFHTNIIAYCELKINLSNLLCLQKSNIVKKKIIEMQATLPRACYSCEDKDECTSYLQEREIFRGVCEILARGETVVE